MSDAPTGSHFDEGEDVYLGFRNKLTFYPLAWGTRKRMRKEFEIVFGGQASNDTDEWQDAVAKILHASAARGNPALTLEAVEDMLDTRNLTQCLRALGVASSLKSSVSSTSGEPQQEASDGPRPTVSPTGLDSTQLSSAPPAGLSPSAIN